MNFSTPLVPDIVIDYLSFWRRRPRVGTRMAALIAEIPVERLRNDHAAGRLPRQSATHHWGRGLCFDIEVVYDHYHGQVTS